MHKYSTLAVYRYRCCEKPYSVIHFLHISGTSFPCIMDVKILYLEPKIRASL